MKMFGASEKCVIVVWVLSVSFNSMVKAWSWSVDNGANRVVVHLVPHSHCDAGYKKTVEEYYNTEVRSILSSTTRHLDLHAHARFVWSETIFLELWWKDSTVPDDLKRTFRRLVLQTKQIELVNGGFVMHDEAITRYESQIGQTALGHDILKQLLLQNDDTCHDHHHDDDDYTVNIQTGYQIDPFGPSSFTPSFMQLAGYDILITNRIPQHIKDHMKQNRELEFWWSPTTNKQHHTNNPIFVHVYDTHYAIPHGFDWEDHTPEAQAMTPIVTPNNVQNRSNDFVSIILQKAAYYKTPHVLIPFGADFRFQNATLQFDNMDKIIDFINSNYNSNNNVNWDNNDNYNDTGNYTFQNRVNIEIRYSTIREYINAISQYMSPMTLNNNNNNISSSSSSSANEKDDDNNNINASNDGFFPIKIGSPFLPLDYWTGFYTQNPNLKQAIRVGEILLRCTELLLVRVRFGIDGGGGSGNNDGDMSSRNVMSSSWLKESVEPSISDALSLMNQAKRTIMTMQHHDALPCTGYHFVMFDYAERVQVAIQNLSSSISILLRLLSLSSTEKNETSTKNITPPGGDTAIRKNKANDGSTSVIVGGGPYLSHTHVIRGTPGSYQPSHVVRVEMGTPTILRVINPRSVPVMNEPVHIFTSRDDIIVSVLGQEEEEGEEKEENNNNDSDKGESSVLSGGEEATIYGRPIPSQVVRLDDDDDANDGAPVMGMFEITFLAHVPALGVATYALQTCYVTCTTDDFPDRGKDCAVYPDRASDEELYENGLGTDRLKMIFNRETMDIESIVTTDDRDEQQRPHKHNLVHRLYEYDGINDTVYQFNDPNGDMNYKPTQITRSSEYSTTGFVGPIYSEARVTFEKGHSIRYRVYKSNDAGLLRNMVQMEMTTSVLRHYTNLVSEFHTSIIQTTSNVSSQPILWNSENGYQYSVHEYNTSRSIRGNFQPLVSRAWIEGNTEEGDGQQRRNFNIFTVDPRGVASTGQGDMHIMWHRRNGNATTYLKSGDDPSRVRSLVWLAFDMLDDNDNGDDEAGSVKMMERAMASDLVAVVVSGNVTLSQFGTFTGISFQQGMPPNVYVSYVSSTDRMLRLVLEEISGTASAVLQLDKLFATPIAKAQLRSLTFLTENQNSACSIDVKPQGYAVTIGSGTLCAIEISLHVLSDFSADRNGLWSMRTIASFACVVGTILLAFILYMCMRSRSRSHSSYSTVNEVETDTCPVGREREDTQIGVDMGHVLT